MNDTALSAAVAAVHAATQDMETTRADKAAFRAQRVRELAVITGSQAAAARALGLDQSTVNKMLRRETDLRTELVHAVARPVQLHLPDIARSLRTDAETIADDTTSTNERAKAARDISDVLIGLGTALEQLANHATSEGNRLAAEREADEAANPDLIENPTREQLAHDEVRMAMLDLGVALRTAMDELHRRDEAARSAATRHLDLD